MNREESAKWAALLQAQADGKKLEWKTGSPDMWVEMTIECTDLLDDKPEEWRIAPDLPPKPSQEWMDKHGVELTGEFRKLKALDLYETTILDRHPALATCRDEACCIGPRWILRRLAPKVKPWTKADQIPVGAVIRRKTTLNKSVIRTTSTLNDGRELVVSIWDEDVLPDAITATHEWCWPSDQFDNKWRPCGEVVK